MVSLDRVVEEKKNKVRISKQKNGAEVCKQKKMV